MLINCFNVLVIKERSLCRPFALSPTSVELVKDVGSILEEKIDVNEGK